jgi:hypothetical protein
MKCDPLMDRWGKRLLSPSLLIDEPLFWTHAPVSSVIANRHYLGPLDPAISC